MQLKAEAWGEKAEGLQERHGEGVEVRRGGVQDELQVSRV